MFHCLHEHYVCVPVSDEEVEDVFPLPCAIKLRVLVLSSPPWGVLNREAEPHDIPLTKQNIKVGRSAAV